MQRAAQMAAKFYYISRKKIKYGKELAKKGKSIIKDLSK